MSATPKRIAFFVLKLVFSVGMLAFIFRKVLRRDGAEDLLARLSDLHWGWVVAAVLMQLIAIGFSTVRWQRLLVGQGIFAKWGFLGGSIMIARFWGAFTPGGFTGFGGWRIYDVAKHTGKTARATATIGVEMILGQLAFGVVVMTASIFGMRFIGTDGVLLVNAVFLSIIVVGLAFLAQPQLFLFFTRFFPEGIRARVQTLIDAVGAYRGKAGLLIQAAALGVGTHAFNNLIYVCAARALGVELSIGEVFFASSLQILATLIPASINGIGLREAAAVALYTSPAVGLPLAVAVLIPTLGFACEMFVSAFGGVIFLLRKSGYNPEIRVEDDDREQLASEAIPKAAREAWPHPIRGLVVGFSAGAFGGILVGLGEAIVIALSSAGATGARVFLYGPLAYGLFCAVFGAGLGFATALSGRWMKRYALPEKEAFAYFVGAVFGIFAFALGAFRIRRDFFHEELVWKSAIGLAVLLGCAFVAAGMSAILARVLRVLVQRAPFERLVHAPTALALLSVLGLGLAGNIALGERMSHDGTTGDINEAGDQAGNVLFLVIDTLRADHLPMYGYEQGSTPNLDRLAEDAIRFDQAFTNSSWTRPSFASILTGRLPSSHGVMAKSDALSDAVTTLPEVLKTVGYATAGYATNFNLAPYFNFHQGFDEYVYLEPAFVLGADDASAKLLLMQLIRQRIEKMRAVRGEVLPGTAYQDAETVNDALTSWIDRRAASPWFLFVGYMDPHDPYFSHPYDGSGYARAAHQHPDPSEAPALTALYDGEISYWDDEFGKLLDGLRERGLYEDLTIIVTSDHGEEFNDHGGFWHGTTLYDEQVHVPLLVKLPQARRGGTVVRHWVQSIDLMPTVLKLLDAPIPEGVQGGDLFTGTDVIYAEESHEGNVLESVRELDGTDEYKLINANRDNPRGLKPIELYRVDLDPSEQENLASSSPDQIRMTTKALLEQRALAKEGGVAADSVEIDADVAAHLEAIGYIER
ncbi:MAG: sulfatase-like hydrolase/transferase [Deltaproteobacteria bacterium]|nr:sulfatase-like hydrolase/transferase [Deltaproteobacteria bacterium]